MRAAAVLLIAGVAACGGEAGEAIHLGLAGPMQQASGRSMLNAAVMAVEEINGSGGVSGRPLELVIRDDGGTEAGAIGAALELRGDRRVLAVVGHINSGATLAAAEIYNDERDGIVELSPASSAPGVAQAGPWTFRVCPSDLQHGGTLAERTVRSLGAQRALVMYANDAYGRGVVSSFARAYRELGGHVVSQDPFPAGASTDEASRLLRPFLERGMQRGMEALVIGGQAGPGLGIIQAARALGFDGPILGADGLTGVRTAGSIAEGVFVSSAYLPDRETPESRRFVELYQSRFGELPDHRAAMTYDAVRLLARVISEGASNREAVRDQLARVGVEEPAFEGVSGTIAFDENGDLRRTEVVVGIVRSGALVTAEDES